MFTLHDLEYLGGHVAAIANHCEDKKLRNNWIQYSRLFRTWKTSMTLTTEIADSTSMPQESQGDISVGGRCAAAGVKV